MNAKDEQIAKLQENHGAFRQQVARVPLNAYDERWLGDWSMNEVLAHMAGWFAEMAGAMDRVSRGERPAPDGVDYNDVEAWNQEFAAQAKQGAEALAEWDAAYDAYLDAAQRLGEDKYGNDPEKGRPRIGDRLLQGSGIAHFEEHQPQLEAWLGERPA